MRAAKGDKGFWEAHDKLFARQQDLLDGKDPNVDVIAQIAVDCGLSAEAAKKAMRDHAYKRTIDGDADLAEDFSANGTPHFFINGRRLVGAQLEEKFDAIIDEEIQKAQALVDHGTRPADVYDAAIKDGKGPPEPETKDLPASLPSHDPVRGNPAAPVVIHEWADFQCPFCARAEPVIEKLAKDYGSQVRIVWHDLPLPMHPDAPLAAEAAREAFAQKGSAGFWALHDLLFADQKKLKRDDLDDAAKGLKLAMDKWQAALDNAAHQSDIDADAKAARDIGITGTPVFIIARANAASGYYVSGAQAERRFRRLIDRTLRSAPGGAPIHAP